MYAADVVARSVSGSWMLACLGCAGSSATPPAKAEPADISECDGDRSPVLRAYDEIMPDVQFSLVLTRDADGVWTPADHLDIATYGARVERVCPA